MKDPKHALDWFRRKKSSPKSPASTPLSSAEDTVTKSGNKAEWVIDGFTFALDLAEQALDIAEVAPFIGPAAVLLHKIIDSYKEWKDADEKRDLLAKRVTDITGDICATVLRMQEMNQSDQIGRLKRDLETYAVLINTASQFIKDYDDQGTLTHFAGRSQMQDELDKLQRELDLFSARFGNNRLVDLCMNQSLGAQTLQAVHDMAVVEKLEKWLKSPPEMTQKQHDTERLRAEGTGQWFLEDKRFIEWEDNPGVLWVEGPSGAGKSVISSTVINDLFEQQAKFTAQAQPFTVAFFYFDFRNKDTQNVETALRRIVLQLSAQSPYSYKTLDQHWELSKGQKLPKYQELLLLVFKLLRELGHTYIVLDALDECDSSNIQDVVRLVAELKAWAETPLHLCITSQPRGVFTKGFTGITQITLGATIIDEDIKFFITTELETNSSLEPWQPHAAQVAEQVTRKASGMFRLAACLLTELSHCSWGEDEELNETLAKLPDTLVGIYDRFMQSIQPRDFPYVQAALRWIMFNHWRINLAMLADAIAFDFSNPVQYTYKPNRKKSNASAIPKWLSGLVRMDKYSVSLAHASVQDYLLSDHFTQNFHGDLNEKHSHSVIARASISYLFYLANDIAEGQIDEDKHPLAEYAATNWYYHILKSDDEKTLFGLGMQLLQDGSKQYQALCRLNDRSEDLPPLCLCCSRGYLECALQLIENGADVNAVDGKNSPLSLASYWGNIDIVQLLLEKGADINVVGGEYDSPLGAASYRGKLDIVQLLLEKGADINVVGGEYGSPLGAASFPGNLDIVQLLLEKGADVNVVNGEYCGPLGAASFGGKLDIVQLLLEKGANIDLVGGKYGSALGEASYGGKAGIVQFLLEKGTDINLVGGDYGSALGVASYGGESAIVQFLLEKGADVNLVGGDYGNALGAACYGNEPDIVKLLLSKGADLNKAGGKYGSALAAASASEYESPPTGLVRFLLENGADIRSQGGHALKEAIKNGYEDVVVLLKEHGAVLEADSSLGTFEKE